MAVKNSKQKELNANYKDVMEALRNPKFAALIDADFTEEVKAQKNPNCIEFRYVKKTTLLTYGRNFFIEVPQVDGNTTTITITTQSRKVTVLFDSNWQASINRIITALEVFL